MIDTFDNQIDSFSEQKSQLANLFLSNFDVKEVQTNLTSNELIYNDSNRT